MGWFSRRAHAHAPKSPAAADAAAGQLVLEERRERLHHHVRRMAKVGAAVTVVLAGVSGYLSTVGLTECRTVEGREVCRETLFHPLSVVKKHEIDVDVLTGERHGWRSEWHASGEPWIQGHYVMGQKDGPWHEYWPTGDLRYEGHYALDTRAGRETWWFANGNPEWTGLFDDAGRKTGTEVWWHDNGAVRRVGTFEKGEKKGQFSLWLPDGTLQLSLVHDGEQG